MKRKMKAAKLKKGNGEAVDYADFRVVADEPIARRTSDAGSHYSDYADLDHAPEDMEEAEEGHDHGDDGNSPDDAVGLYLRQMGAIPLLTRAQELTLARRLERLRDRFRWAALRSWVVLARREDTAPASEPVIEPVGALT